MIGRCLECEGCEGTPLGVQGYVGGGYCEVGRDGVLARADAGRRIEVEVKVVEVCEGFCY